MRLSNNSNYSPLQTTDESEEGEGLVMQQPNDPFYVVRDNVNAQVERIKVRHDKFQDMLRNSDTASSGEFKELRKGLIKDLRTSEKDIAGLRVAIDMVEKNRVKFPHIKDSELVTRKMFVQDLAGVVAEIKASMESESVRKKIEEDFGKSKRDEREGAFAALGANSSNPVERENARFISKHKMETRELISQQDVALESLGDAVDRLGVIGREVGEELKEQNVLLTDLDRDLDDAGNKMNVVMAALSKLLKTKDGCMIWTIVILGTCVVVVVVVVVTLSFCHTSSRGFFLALPFSSHLSLSLSLSLLPSSFPLTSP